MTIASLVVGCWASAALAVVVEYQSPGTEVLENATDPPSSIAIEDPAPGTKYGTCSVSEWRDADAGGSPHWIPTGTVEGSSNQAWLRDGNAAITTTTTVPSNAVTFNLEGDNNDGRTDLFVDGARVATLDMWDSGHNRVLVTVRSLPSVVHTLLADDLGATQQQGASGDDIAVWGGAALACDSPTVPALSCWAAALLAGGLATAGVLFTRRTPWAVC